MFGLLMLICAIIIMVKVADIEGRSSLVWGFATFVSCIACSILIPWPLIDIVVGLGVSYGTMFALKLAGI
jgi:hypothetical protein